ncbi:hypothetical protein [Pseudomonas violetae]|jgi:hypothetical protein|uniref:Uncharacterized protein n=1 Tax=Pseudomonas violetae TaxID=2915813 RepID=A0ABT0F1X2_9PSED|nr:hypothetical protein [Pseudomonas violetae]MCK1791681.1 hypothetical protein [Pseudomonas violetae]
MSLTVGLSNARVIIMGNKAADAPVRTETEASAQVVTAQEGDKRPLTLAPAQQDAKTEDSSSSQSITVQMLLKRMKELQQQMREQQQQLAATQATTFANEEAKATAVMAIQQRIADTAGAIAQVAGALAKALTEGSASGSMVSTSV